MEEYLTTNTAKASTAWDVMQRDLSQAVTSNVYISTTLDDTLIGLGIKKPIPEEFDSPSIWGTLSNLAKFVSEQEETLRGLAISEAMDRAHQLFTSEAAELKRFLTTNYVSGNIFQDFLNQLGAQISNDRLQGDTTARNEVRALKDKLSQLESQLTILSNNSVSSSTGGSTGGLGYNSFSFGPNPVTNQVPYIPNPSDKGKLSSLEDKLLNLEKEFIRMKSDKDTTIVKFGALGFKELADAEAYITRVPGAMNFGLFVDIYVVCILVTKEIDGEIDFLKKLENVTKLNLNSLREATGMAAFSSPIPDLFTKAGGGLYGKNESAFSRYPSYQKWKESGKETIPEKLTSVKEGLLKAVTDYVPTDSPAHAIMTLSVSESCANLRAFCDFLTQTVESLESYGMPTQKAWNLGTRLGEAYFRALVLVCPKALTPRTFRK